LPRPESFGARARCHGRAPSCACTQQAIAEKNAEYARVDERLAHVALHLPVKVPHTEDRDRVHQAMQTLPAAAEAAHHAVGGGNGERNQQ